jgi:uncharacterized protein YndB with AHSA1/START domain
MSYDLRLERIFDAKPEIVFDALLDPAAQRALLADGPDWVVESELDLRVGGTWIVEFGPSPSDLYREVAVFSEVDRPRRLVYDVTATSRRTDARHRDGDHVRVGERQDPRDAPPDRVPDRQHAGQLQGRLERDLRCADRGRRRTNGGQQRMTQNCSSPPVA